ncbi:MAG: DUF1997 domain-containing protein [Woronichinia naegeliana WA131]|uniref:DUF1997 domain-containing protein n=1 Tax=Woronichinia naegeliana WA131 TaxID=2824559 RepID=A0A977L2X5_9CYAN|nr:MAG: DUF1997 domain-containing protein [Woronichinia naegeliana WA131]
MKTEPLGEDGYVMTIGQFGALGFDIYLARSWIEIFAPFC